jgi:hypothetical protein
MAGSSYEVAMVITHDHTVTTVTLTLRESSVLGTKD